MAKLSFGACYFSAPAVTTLVAGVPAKAEGTTVAMQLGGFLHPTNNRLEYDQLVTRTFLVSADVSATKSGGGSSLVSFLLYKNGAMVPGARVNRQVSTVDEGAVAVQCNVQLAQGDYVELWVQTDDGDDVTIEAGTLDAQVIG